MLVVVNCTGLLEHIGDVTTDAVGVRVQGCASATNDVPHNNKAGNSLEIIIAVFKYRRPLF